MFGQRFLSPRTERVAGSSSSGDALVLSADGFAETGDPSLTQRRLWTLRIARPELAVLLVVAGGLNLSDLSRNGWANGYYAAAVRSMMLSWHNFLFASFDPTGVMTVDKPPLALWVQALSARIFGLHSLSILVPQALMGVVTVALVYDLVRRRFGRLGGFAAGLTLAITPITVAMSRHNNPDAAVALCDVAALWCAVRGFEDGRTRWIVWSGVMVGLGFEAKMGTALLIVPALAAAWLWASPHRPLRAIRQLLSGGAAMALVGGAWPLLVTLTPAAARPWISGTADNSIWSLITGYNGLGRVAGQAGNPGAATGRGFGGASTLGGGSGVLRLLNSALGGQAGWLLGFAIVSGLGLIVATRLRRRDPDAGWLVAVGGAFLASAVVFSYAQGIFHPYYVSFLAPFSAALVGAGAAQLARDGRHARILAPLAIAGGVATELAVMHSDQTLAALQPVVVGVGAVTAIALMLLSSSRLRLTALGAVLATLSIAPAAWAVDTLGHATSGTFPAGGPQNVADGPAGPGGFHSFGGRGGFPGGGIPGGGFPGRGLLGGALPGAGGFPNAGGPPPGGALGPGGGVGPAQRGGLFGGGAGGFGGAFGGRSLKATLSYISAHGGGPLAVSAQTTAETAIIDSAARVAGIGGFSGNESEVSATWLAHEIRAGKIRWVLDTESSFAGFGGGFGGISGGRVGSRLAMQWVSSACRRATATDGGVLYDCAGRAERLLRVTGLR